MHRDARRRRPIRVLVLSLTISVGVLFGGCGGPVTVTIGSKPAASVAPTVASGERVASPSASAAPTAAPTHASSAPAAGYSGARLRTAPPSEISIPSLDLESEVINAPVVVDGSERSWELPREVAAHLSGTANPGEPGNIVISGHVNVRDGQAVFAKIANLIVGDTIVVRSEDGEFSYRVDSLTIVPESDLSVMLQTPDELLTLITCVNDGVFDKRVIVRARPA